ncbi:hypothetical protein G9A89_014493 [Geosiphon pyriformis]|nr:hypothetical protein G9A89_014493 [Geosiphon pyriformis]
MDCFLTGAICALTLYNLFLDGAIPNVFQARLGIFILNILGMNVYMNVVKSLRRYGFVFANQILNCYDECFIWETFHKWKRLDSRGLIPVWFMSLSNFVRNSGLSGNMALASHYTCADLSCNVGFVSEHILISGCSSIKVYMNGSVRGMGTIGVCGGAAAYFPVVDVSIGVRVHGLLSLTLVELQAIVLALECVSASSAVTLFMDSQMLLDMCKFDVNMPEDQKTFRCDLVEDLNYLFLCKQNRGARKALLLATQVEWCKMVGCSVMGDSVVKSLCKTGSTGGLYIMLAKEFVLKSWVADITQHFGFKSGGDLVIRFFYEKHNLLPCDGSAVSLVAGLLSIRSVGVIHGFGIKLGIHVCFGLHSCLSNLDFGFLSHVPVVDSVDV